ncbi:MAG: site-2 protease family protein [Mailhella sp.]|nr:site-2 protease family protein [Mailhella sp.]
MFDQSISQSISHIAVAFVPVLLGIILHEIAHGWVALKRGDPTAWMLGRLTLNPAPHIDPMGMGMFAFTAMFTPFVFGWAKPVPINPRYFRNPRRDMLLVSAAGPITNMLLALLFAGALRLLLSFAPHDFLLGSSVGKYLLQMFQTGIIANFTLAWVNLIPIPPLDGGHIVEGLLPRSAANWYGRIERFGFLAVVVLLASGAMSSILTPLIRWSWNTALWMVGI